MPEPFYNQHAVDWAKRNLVEGVVIKLRFSSRLSMILVHGLIFLVPLIFFLTGIVVMLSGVSDKDNTARSAVMCGFVLLIPSGIIALLGLWVRRRTPFAKYLDTEGVSTNQGGKLLWKDIYYVDHVSKWANRGELSNKQIKDNQLELVFANGKAVIPPLVHDRAKMWQLINSMPVQVRDDGEVRDAST